MNKKSWYIILFLISCVVINTLGTERVNAETENKPVEVVASYSKNVVPKAVLEELREIATQDNTVNLVEKGDTITIDRLYSGAEIENDGTTRITPFTASFVQLPAQERPKVINFQSWIEKMDVRNNQTNLKSGTMFIAVPSTGGGYSGQSNGEKVKKGTHVHCNRFNGTKSDHRYWKKSNPKSWIDFYHSDCDYHAAKYGCTDMGSMSKCDGLDKRGKGVKDCSSWSGGPKHTKWPKTCWYRN